MLTRADFMTDSIELKTRVTCSQLELASLCLSTTLSEETREVPAASDARVFLGMLQSRQKADGTIIKHVPEIGSTQCAFAASSAALHPAESMQSIRM